MHPVRPRRLPVQPDAGDPRFLPPALRDSEASSCTTHSGSTSWQGLGSVPKRPGVPPALCCTGERYRCRYRPSLLPCSNGDAISLARTDADSRRRCGPRRLQRCAPRRNDGTWNVLCLHGPKNHRRKPACTPRSLFLCSY
jgi:hypothetical protein